MITIWLIVAAVSLGALLLVTGTFFSLWLSAYVSGVRVSLVSLVLMPLRRVDPKLVVRCRVMAAQAGLENFSTSAVESQILAGGDVTRVTLALIAAHRARIPLDWDTAAAIDLAGRDVLEAVRVSVNPQIIDCPDPADGRGTTLNGVSRDGIQLKVRVRVTVRTNVAKLVGGATEQTVIARVGEGIVSSIGSCESYRDALSDPRVITRRVIEKGLDAQTAFAIVSIDIADIDVGTNIGAELQIEQANADIRIARAAAEERRAMAMARAQEMRALARYHESLVVLAEAEIPESIALAFRRGQMRATESDRRVHGSDRFPRLAGGASNSPRPRLRASGAGPTREVDTWETEGGATA